MTYVFRLFDYFLPASIRSNPTDMLRGYVIVGLIISNIVLSVVVFFGLIYLLELEENTLTGVTLNALCMAGCLITLLLLRTTQNYFLCANFLIITLACVIFYAVQITGGYFGSPILQVTSQLPVWGFLLLGLRAGFFWLLITIAGCIACYFSAVMNVGYVQLLPDQALIDAMFISLQFILLVMIGGALTIYETINGRLTRQLNEERNRFEHKASHDHLTGVPNRFEFFRRLKSEIEDAGERSHKVAVVYIDLDGFKPINDLLGHHMGDEALMAVAQRLQKILRLSDTTARLGGDEFALILPGIHIPVDIDMIMPKVLATIKEPISVNGVDIVVKASCGVAIFPEHSKDHSALCRYADMAMYQAKEHHDAYLVFNESMKVKKPSPQ
jgi:diguanylate cyclase (GGDEF)-like protein